MTIKATVSLSFFACRILLLVHFLVASIIGGSVSSAWATTFFERAQEYVEKGEWNAARIELKNALQHEPNNAAARFLLGKVYLQQGDARAAEDAFLRARDLGYASEDLDLMLAHARLGQRRFNAVVSEIGDKHPIESALQRDLHVARGEALLGLGKFDEAREVFDRVLQGGPHARAMVNKARLAMALGDDQAARNLLDAAAKIDAREPSFVAVDASWYFRQRRFAEAKERFALAAQLAPTKLENRMGQIQSLLALGELEQAAQEIDKLENAGSDLPVIVLQDAIVQFLSGRYLEAETAAERVLAVANRQPQALLVAGLSAYQLAHYNKANAHLSAYLAENPQDTQARMALGATMLQLGKAEHAYGTLTELENQSVPDDTGYLNVLSSAAFGTGDKEAGLKYLEQLAAKNGDNAEVQEKLGVARQSSGDDAGATAALKRAIALAPDRLSAYTSLFAVHLHQKQLDKAIEIARRIQAQFPGKVIGDTLQGIAYLAKGEFDQARQAFQHAVEKEPNNAEAAGNLANMLVMEGNVPEARKVLDGVLETRPKHFRTLMASAELAIRAWDGDKAEALWRRAVEVSPDAPQPRIALSNHYTQTNRATDALALAEPALAKNPKSVGLLATVGQARVRTGDLTGALETFRRLTALAPTSPRAQVLLMRALEINGRIAEALDAAKQALALDPSNLQARLGEVRILAQLGRLDDAKANLEALKTELPDQAELLLLEGRIALVERRGDDAVAAYRKAFLLQRNNGTLIELSQALFATGKAKEVLDMIQAWLKDYPQDVLVRGTLAEAQVAVGLLAEADKQYVMILGLTPTNVRALNNLAWVRMSLDKKDEAVGLARKARTVAPESASVADTLGVILLETGQTQEAFELLQWARRAEPNDLIIQFHFARALATNGRVADAVAELQALLKEQVAFPDRPQAEALLAELTK